jgi:PAS domain S-box-containing protein
MVEQEKIQEALRQSESRFRELADAMPQIVWVTRPDGYHEYYNRRWYEFTGVTEGSTDGGGWNGVFHPDDQGRAWDRWRRSLASGEAYEIEYRLRHRSGEYRWTLGRALPIRNEQGEIVRWFGTCTDIDAMKRLTAEREVLLARERAARAEAEAANQAKDKFLAVLSHELRTPLSPVVMAIPAMERDAEMPAKFQEELAMVRRNIDLEVKLIDDLLDLSRVTSGKLQLRMQPVSVHELLMHVLRSSLSETSNKRLSIRHQLHASNDGLIGDPARLQQVFWNLLRNAVKFTPEGGEVSITTWNDTDDEQGVGRLVVEVKDTGVGIPAELLPRIFDAFEQGDERMTRQFGGLGLGLAIAKAVVEMHGGTISAKSEGRDRGASFTVQLRAIEANAVREVGPQAEGRAARKRSARPKVLLVEDHPDTVRTLARLLQSSGYDVKTANSVASALQIAAAEHFDILVSDIGLPDATGYDLMKHMKERYGLKGIALSGYGMEDDMKRSREAGFVDHVIKPVNVEQLEVVIGRVLGARGE